MILISNHLKNDDSDFDFRSFSKPDFDSEFKSS